MLRSGSYVLVLLMMTCAAQVAADEPFPIVGSGAGAGGMWYAVKVPAGTTCLWLNSTHEGASSGFGIKMYVLYDANLTLVSRHLLASWSDELEVQASSDGMGSWRVQPIPYQQADWNSWDTVFGCDGSPPSTAARTMLVIRQGDALGNWTFSAASPDGNPVNATYGTADLYQARNFGGLANLHLGVGLPTARATVSASRNAEILDHLIGAFVARGTPSIGVMEATTPSGDIACPCIFDAHSGPDAQGPGSYQFRLSELGLPDSETALLLADIVLPG